MKNPGTLIEIADGQLNIYVSGNGPKVLVFLSGGLTSSPLLDFKTLSTSFTGDFTLVIIEKFGYGFSSDSQSSREIDVMLEQTRELLNLKGIKPPFVLIPHSMSGIEALRWIDLYPEEVTALIGLDMANHEAYQKLQISLVGLKLNRLLVKMKVTKLFPRAIESDAVKYGNLTDSEKNLFAELFYKNFTSTAVMNEVIAVKKNAEKVKQVDLSKLPLLIFSSNGQGTGIKTQEWLAIQEKLCSQSAISELVLLDCPHYIHNHQPVEIAEKIQQFLQSR